MSGEIYFLNTVLAPIKVALNYWPPPLRNHAKCHFFCVSYICDNLMNPKFFLISRRALYWHGYGYKSRLQSPMHFLNLQLYLSSFWIPFSFKDSYVPRVCLLSKAGSSTVKVCFFGSQFTIFSYCLFTKELLIFSSQVEFFALIKITIPEELSLRIPI